jgi:hypothetical protein
VVFLSSFVAVGAFAAGVAALVSAAGLVIGASDVDGGRPTLLGFTVMFGSFAFLGGDYAWQGRKTALVAFRRRGVVAIDGDLLRIEVPGLLRFPIELHRAWVASAEVDARYGLPATTLAAGMAKGVCVIHLRQSIGIPQVVPPPGFDARLARRPDPSVAVDAVALDLELADAAAKAIDHWAHQNSSTAPPEPPTPGPVDHRRRTRRLAACVVCAAALVSLNLSMSS